MRSPGFAALAALLLVACSEQTGPPIVVSDVHVLAPLPGSNAGVAYLTIANRGGSAVTIRDARSPQFERVEIHETTTEGGVSQMRRLDAVEIPAGGSLAFEPGGRHMMLIGMLPDTGPGSPVTIEIDYTDALVVISATMQDRIRSE
jgi:copper(I)-binding protein